MDEEFSLEDCTGWKVLQRSTYLKGLWPVLQARSEAKSGLQRLELHYPFRNPFPGVNVVLCTHTTGDETADVVFQTRNEEDLGSDAVTVSGPAGTFQGIRPRKALTSYLASMDSDASQSFDHMVTAMSKTVMQTISELEENEQHAVRNSCAVDELPFHNDSVQNNKQIEEPQQDHKWSPQPSGWHPQSPDWRPPAADWKPSSPEWKPPAEEWKPRQSDWKPPAEWMPSSRKDSAPADEWQPRPSDWHPASSEWRPPASEWHPREMDWKPPPEWQPPVSEWEPPVSDWQPPVSEWQQPLCC